MKEHKATVESVTEHSEEVDAPILMTFANGELAVTSKENAQFTCMVNKKTKRKSAMVTTTEHVYHGVVGNTEADELTDLYLCVRDKTTNKVSIVPIQQAHLNNHIYNELEVNRMEELSKENAMKKMLKEFGGRNAMKYVAKTDKFKMNAALLKDEVDNSVNDATLSTEDDGLDSTSHLQAIRPKFNKDATTLSEVYNVEDVVPAKLLEVMNEDAAVVYKTKISQLPVKSEFIRGLIDGIQKSVQSPKNMLNLKLIIYMDCLLNLITASTRSMRNHEISAISENVENDVRKRFCDQNTKNLMLTKTLSEKALCHVIVLAILINENYEVNVNELSSQLQTNKKKVIQYAQIVNARLKSKTDILSLRLPSKVPALRTAYAKNKRK